MQGLSVLFLKKCGVDVITSRAGTDLPIVTEGSAASEHDSHCRNIARCYSHVGNIDAEPHLGEAVTVYPVSEGTRYWRFK